MTPLRRELLLAREQYRTVRYSGNLAADVMPMDHARRRWMIGGATLIGAALAACLVLMVWIRTTPVTTTPEIGQDEVADVSLGHIPAMPPMPENIEIVPQHVELAMPSMPSMPSLSDIAAEEQQQNSRAAGSDVL
jgi:hypothetical protein